MKALQHLISFLILLSLSTTLIAQTPTEPNEGTKLEYDSVNQIYRFRWWGRAGSTYFIQHTEDLQQWFFVPIVEPGNDSIKEWGFTISGDKFFIRLQYNTKPSSDPNDVDGDGLTNSEEFALNSNPAAFSTSGDGLPDGWKHFFGLDLFTNYSGTLIGGIPINQIANPGNPALGSLSVTISSPANGATIP